MARRALGLTLFILALTIVYAGQSAAGQEATPAPAASGPGQRYTEAIPVYDTTVLGWEPVVITDTMPMLAGTEWGGASPVPAGQFRPLIHKSGPVYLSPGATARYEITVANSESVTRTVRLSDTLPSQLAYAPGSATGLTYDAATRTLSWKGELAPGQLDIVIAQTGTPLPYLDLADFGAANLCDDFIASGSDCDDVTVTFNLGVNGYNFTLYGQSLSQITLSSNGLALGEAPAQDDHNQWLPDEASPGFLLAGLWRDVDMTAAGRWHAAVVTGLVANHDVFYAQWHNAPDASNPDLTTRHAIAVILNGGALSGHAFFIYDNVFDPARLVARGYTIGVEDKLGMRGATHAYAACCGDSRPPRGYPPAPGTALHLMPVMFGAGNAYSRTFSYEAVVNAQVPETVANTAFYASDSPDPALSQAWATHYLYVRRQTFLPLFLAPVEAGP
jgi:uncharacterized repeat protein (TIGR01451 family)